MKSFANLKIGTKLGAGFGFVVALLQEGLRGVNEITLGIAKAGNHTVTLLDLSRGFSLNGLVVLRSAARSTEQRNIPA